MKENDFFEKQSALTFAKTTIYKEYIERYLLKLLISHGRCLIADLFCGAGKNGKENGSPLILIDRLNYILTSPILKSKSELKIYIILNDQDKNNIDNLKNELSRIEFDRTIISISVNNEKYEDLLPKIIKTTKGIEIPKFFFLDPFKYSDVKMEHLRILMALPLSEVLLFIPIFHSYRFAKKEYDKNHKTRIFIEEFTSEGITDYGNVTNFVFSVREKLMKDVSLEYVRPVLLKDGAKQNALFLLTNHQKGMLLMNQIAFKITSDGNLLNVKNQDQDSLFKIEEVSNFANKLSNSLVRTLRKRDLTNKEIVRFAIQDCFLPKHAKQELKKLYELQKIKVFDINNTEIIDTRKWNIAEDIKKMVIFKWISDEKK